MVEVLIGGLSSASQGKRGRLPFCPGGHAVRDAPLLPLFHPGRDRSRSPDQRGTLARIELALEANADRSTAEPPDYRYKSKSPAVQSDGRSDRQRGRAIELCATGRQVQDLDRMAFSIGLKERRQRHGDSRVDSALRTGITFLGGRKRAWHCPGVPAGCFQSLNACAGMDGRRGSTAGIRCGYSP